MVTFEVKLVNDAFDDDILVDSLPDILDNEINNSNESSNFGKQVKKSKNISTEHSPIISEKEKGPTQLMPLNFLVILPAIFGNNISWNLFVTLPAWVGREWKKLVFACLVRDAVPVIICRHEVMDQEIVSVPVFVQRKFELGV